ncbi:hypothetical protein O6H91_10G053400 [Diphasiastrum complanatum]|uniref:Uncharacterized protein n=1 Tax=Diphasiastrum complanatum TaxID=34168 RepID=A0ACC2CH34_DIPCM|nr:hypothetical protein O6H91_10G053400 [Diphasiastrum complanatum]
MAKLRDLCCYSTLLLLLLSILACFLCAVLASQNFRFFLFITSSLVLISFPELVNFVLGSLVVCVLAIARAGGTDSISKLLSKKISCVESDISKVIKAVVNEEDLQAATKERDSIANVETEKVIEEVSNHGTPSEFPTTETHVEKPEQPYTTTQLKVALHCEGCKRKIVEALCRMEGVKKIDISMRKQRVVVSGFVDPMKVLKKVKKTGKNVELWLEEASEAKPESDDKPQQIPVPETSEAKPESDDKPQQIPVSDEEKLVQHLECPAVSSTSTCIDEPQYHIAKEAEETEIKAMEDCPVEPFAMDADVDQEAPVILGTINLKRYTFLDAEVNPSNPRYLRSYVDGNVARDQHSRPAMVATNKEVRPLYAARDDVYHKDLHPAYRRESLGEHAYSALHLDSKYSLHADHYLSSNQTSETDAYENSDRQAGYRRLRKPAGYPASGNYYTDRNFAHRSSMPNPQKQHEDDSVTEISDTSDDEAQKLYAVVRTKKGSMKFVPVEASSVGPIAGELPPHYEQIKRSKSSRRAEGAQDAYSQPSNAKHYADCNYWPSNKLDSQYARLGRYYPQSFKNEYRSRTAYRMHHNPPCYAHEKEESQLNEHNNNIYPCKEDPMHPCEHEQVQRRRAHPRRMHMQQRYNATERDQ